MISKIKTKPDLSVDFAGIKLKNPVLTASGTFRVRRGIRGVC